MLINVAGGDDDGDGVSNLNDNCPNTFTNAFLVNKLEREGKLPPDYKRVDKVQSNGCPEATQEQDADGDTVLDSRDNCEKVPNTDQLDFDTDGIGNVCDADDDNDGIHDAGDTCPGTVGPQVRAAAPRPR